MKKIVDLITISTCWLLLISLPEIQAQQTAPLPSKTALSSAVSIEELKTRRVAIENRVDIDTEVKTDSLKYIDQAIAYLEMADSNNVKAIDLTKLVQTAPERIKILQKELKRPFTELEKITTRAQQMSTLKIEQRVRQKEAELATAQNRLREWSERLTAEKGMINQTTEDLATATNRLKEIQAELKTIPEAADTDILNHSRMLSLESEDEKISAEIKLIELRQRSRSLLVELFSMERDYAQKRVESRKKMLKKWQTEIQKRREQEAVQARDDAQDAIVQVPLMPLVVQEQFTINIQLSAELEKVTGEETQLAKKYEEYQNRLKALKDEFDTAKMRVKSAVLTAAIGLALRTQRLNLPSADRYLAGSEDRQLRMSEISEKQIALERLLGELSDPQAFADGVIGSVSFQSDKERKSLALKIKELLANRLDLIQKLKLGYDRLFKLMQNIEFTEQTLVNTAEDFGELLDRHLLWIRSSKPVRFGDFSKLSVSVGWFFNPASWGELFRDMGRAFRQRTTVWIVGVLVGLLLIFSRRWARRKLKEIAEQVDQQVEDSFLLTIKALGLTALLAAVWPFLLVFTAIQMTRLQQTGPFSVAIFGGLINVAFSLIFLMVFYHICREHGLAHTHFQWPESARRSLKRNLRWLIPTIMVSSFLVGAMETVPEFEFSDALAKVALMVSALAISIFTARILRFNGGITSVIIEKYSKGWLCRLRYLWYPLSACLPLFIIWLAAAGYYYSAIEISHLIRDTIVLTLTVIVFNDLILRMLMLASRRIALKKAIAKQELYLESSSGSDASPDPDGAVAALKMEPIIEMSEIDEQTRSLLKLCLTIFFLVGIWTIWEPVFPAFGILQDIQFWSYSTVVDGVSATVPITLANVIMAVLVAVATIIASRNLPGLLEVILLNRLAMIPGTRYAYSTICRYAITALGIIVAFNIIGMRWSNLQWLVAALSVGLGFGLQEIVANFICGLIVLFERPFRVGDTVTIGDINGTVTRIRIRATTIVDWDRKELIVPNKEFVVGRLINWSLSDKQIRIRIPVGVAYGSDTKLAEQLLLQAARKNPRVLAEPAPHAFFRGFGDNSLDFELRVYINGIENLWPMQHELNFAIDKGFRDAGVTIAFPQRDVHLDATGPLEVHVVSESSGSKAGKRLSAIKE